MAAWITVCALWIMVVMPASSLSLSNRVQTAEKGAMAGQLMKGKLLRQVPHEAVWTPKRPLQQPFAVTRAQILHSIEGQHSFSSGINYLPHIISFMAIMGALLIRTLKHQRAQPAWSLLSVDGEADTEAGEGNPLKGYTPAFNKMGQEKEVDSQYRKLRLLIYASVTLVCGGLAIFYALRLVSLLQSTPEADLQDAIADLTVNVFGVILVAILFRVDKLPEQKLLVRSEEGGAIATLRIRYGGDRIMVGAMRRQEGKKAGKRVILLACNPLALQSHLQYLKPSADAIAAKDLIIVPIALPMTRATTIDHTLAYRGLDRTLFQGPHVAVPNGGDWVSIFGAECDKALAAGVLPVETGFALLIERDGRVGRRIPGLPSLEELLALPEEL